MAAIALNKSIHYNGNHQVKEVLENHDYSSLGQRYEQLLLSEKYCDCIFSLSGHQIKCHKLILATASPVFEAMFYGPLCEQSNFIDILDMNEHIFRRLVHFIYKGCLDFQQLTLEGTIELYYGAEKYLIQELINECLRAIQTKLRFSNILPALELSVCLDLQHLLDICLKFFKRCCLRETEPQFMSHLKMHYYHVTKDCLKVLVKNFREHKCDYQQTRNFLEFFHEWCKAESKQYDLTKISSFITELDTDIMENIKDIENACSNNNKNNEKDVLAIPHYILSVERCYYKACRPFTVTSDTYEWWTYIKCSRFIVLHGVTLHSRLLPNFRYGLNSVTNASNEYMENLCVTIKSLQSSNDNDNSDRNCQLLTWTWNVKEQPTEYNCNLTIKWPFGVVLSIDTEYQIKLEWSPSLSNGAEYPCSLMSNQVQDICFRDQNYISGALIKGLHYAHLN